jgi:hypothetical protein
MLDLVEHVPYARIRDRLRAVTLVRVRSRSSYISRNGRQGVPIVNITPPSSSAALREQLEALADRYGINVRVLVAEVYTYAAKNQEEFSDPLDQAVKRGGLHIGATVSDATAAELTAWAKKKKTPRGRHCAFVLEKALESGVIKKILKERS